MVLLILMCSNLLLLLFFSPPFYQIAIIVLMAVAYANAKPAVLSVAPVAYSAPLVAPAAAALPYVAATSSQVVRKMAANHFWCLPIAIVN